jgi:hypothetical protein
VRAPVYTHRSFAPTALIIARDRGTLLPKHAQPWACVHGAAGTRHFFSALGCCCAEEVDLTSPIICPVCGLEIVIDTHSGEIALTYSVPDWQARCTSQRGDGPSFCINAQPLILELLGKQGNNGMRNDG